MTHNTIKPRHCCSIWWLNGHTCPKTHTNLKTLYLIFQNRGYDGQTIIGAYTNLGKALIAFTKFADTSKFYIDNRGFFCSFKQAPIVINGWTYYIQEIEIDNQILI